MASCEHTVEIERPVDDVFAFLSEPSNYPTWQASLVKLRPHTRGPLRRGFQATEVRRFMGREMETTWTCTEHRPSTRSTIESPNGPVPFRGTFALAPLGESTCFTWTVETWGSASGLAGPLIARATRRELEANTRRLKEMLEGDEFGPPSPRCQRPRP